MSCKKPEKLENDSNKIEFYAVSESSMRSRQALLASSSCAMIRHEQLNPRLSQCLSSLISSVYRLYHIYELLTLQYGYDPTN